MRIPVLLLTLLLLGLLLGCSTATALEQTATISGPSPTQDASPTLSARVFPTAQSTPSFTAPPVPPMATPMATLSLGSHRWKAPPVLVELNTKTCRDACIGLEFSTVPDWILYADGRLIADLWLPEEHEFQLQERQLSRTEICALLNTIGQTGFLDYDFAPYLHQAEQAGTGMSSLVLIEVNAWQNQRLRTYDHYGDEFAHESVPPALRATYSLLANYDLGNLTIYQPTDLLMLLAPAGSVENPANYFEVYSDWTFDNAKQPQLTLS